MGTMLDTVGDPASTFHGLQFDAIAAYGNGRFANYAAAKKEFPHVHILEIDVSGQGIGNAGDFEAGDIAYAHAASWAQGRIAAGVKRPVIYFSVGQWPAIFASLHAANLPREHVRLWTAHYTGKPHLCSPECAPGVTGHADATQWGTHGPPSNSLPPDLASRNLDISMTSDSFFS
jgi:hypothetical protein